MSAMEKNMEEKKPTARELIDALGLTPLPEEGGMSLQTYISQKKIGDEPGGTAIYYLLSGEAFSHLHRLTGDEIYHFYLGDPVELTELLPDGSVRTTVLGQDVLGGQKVQHVVLAGHWQGSRLRAGGSFALLGTTMCPGYTDACYEHGDGEALKRQYPQAEKAIRALTGQAKYE